MWFITALLENKEKNPAKQETTTFKLLSEFIRMIAAVLCQVFKYTYMEIHIHVLWYLHDTP